jgi:hypothetical protein
MTFVVLVPKSNPIVANMSSPDADCEGTEPAARMLSKFFRFSAEIAFGAGSRTAASGGSSQYLNGSSCGSVFDTVAFDREGVFSLVRLWPKRGQGKLSFLTTAVSNVLAEVCFERTPRMCLGGAIFTCHGALGWPSWALTVS